MNKSINISVTCDELMEGEERFEIGLKSTNSSQVSLSKAQPIGIIMDSTGKTYKVS